MTGILGCLEAITNEKAIQYIVSKTYLDIDDAQKLIRDHHVQIQANKQYKLSVSSLLENQ